MSFEWDPAKAEANVRKHGVDFADAAGVFEDDLALVMEEQDSGDEQRWVVLGIDSLGRVLVVVYTFRGTQIRLISARPATPREQASYAGR